ncbi:hypothetical protein C8Q76DRAFT_626320, partial [Earliella scabrosa]
DPITRNGLKKIHARFDQIYSQLDRAFTEASAFNDIQTMGGVIGIMTRMCVDGQLTCKLVDNGMIQKVSRLLDFDSAQVLGLRALSMATLHNLTSSKPGEDVAALHSTLSTLALQSEDIEVVELIVTIMAHATRAVLRMDRLPERSTVQSMALTDTLPAVLRILRRPQISYPLLTHAIDLIVTPAYHCPEECKSVPSLVPFLAALTRSSNIDIRASAMVAIIHIPHAGRERETPVFRPQQLVDSLSNGIPTHLLEVFTKNGIRSLEICRILDAVDEYQRAMCEAERAFNPRSLGRRLGDIIQRHSLAVGENELQTVIGDGDIQRPAFPSWLDALPMCAQTLRATKDSSDLDYADILDIKFLDTRGLRTEAQALAKKSISRNPALAYAYLVIGFGADIEEGLLAAKKGLKCPDTTPFIRSQLLFHAVTRGAQLGLQILQKKIGPSSVERGSELLVSALEDAETFILEAAPDNFWLLTVLNWHILLTVLVHGPELSETLEQLQETRTRITTTMQVMDFVQYILPHRQLSTACKLLFDSYSEGLRDWGHLVTRFDVLNIGLRRGFHVCPAERLVQLGGPQIKIHRCSWCNMPSAILKQCARCHTVTYCDISCQRSHWAEHKAVCSR